MRLGPPKRRSSAPLVFILLLTLGGALTAGGLATFRTGDPPTVSIEADKTAIAKETRFTIVVEEPTRGVTDVEVAFLQGSKLVKLEEKHFPAQPPWAPWGPKETRVELSVVVGRATMPGLIEGPAKVRVLARGAGTWLRAPIEVEAALERPVRLTPPTLSRESSHVYATQGGSEAVVYRVGPTAVRHGVRAGDWFFPGAPLPGGEADQRFVIFAVPYDVDDEARVKLVAIDDVENELAIPVLDLLKPKPYKTDSIEVSDRFMNAVVPTIMARTPGLRDRGALVDNYVAINNELRAENAETLEALAARSEPRFLWTRPFSQMPAKVFSSLADRRTYVYEGKQIDQQFHLGYDLASTRQAPVPCANEGVVVLADYLGIYGNTVVVDHGFGLMTLYGHLSSLGVKVGDRVTRDQELGRTGATGLALGDHLHFTMLLHGLPVLPLEWWDASWIENRVAAKLGAALAFARE